jgi:hypothetical protein
MRFVVVRVLPPGADNDFIRQHKIAQHANAKLAGPVEQKTMLSTLSLQSPNVGAARTAAYQQVVPDYSFAHARAGVLTDQNNPVTLRLELELDKIAFAKVSRPPPDLEDPGAGGQFVRAPRQKHSVAVHEPPRVRSRIAGSLRVTLKVCAYRDERSRR